MLEVLNAILVLLNYCKKQDSCKDCAFRFACGKTLSEAL